MNTVESFGAPRQLESKKTAAETYQTFYNLFGAQALKQHGSHGWHMVLNRVLHFDQDDSRNMHVVVARSNSSINLPIRRRYNALGLPRHQVSYRASDFVVAASDGATISTYAVKSAMGTYKNHLNGVDKQYNPRYEDMQLQFISVQGQGSARFQLSSGDGVFAIEGYPTGWILSEAESVRITSSLLESIGHTAIAS